MDKQLLESPGRRQRLDMGYGVTRNLYFRLRHESEWQIPNLELKPLVTVSQTTSCGLAGEKVAFQMGL
jgi:hypothetical protein